MRDQRTDQRRLADAGRPGDPDREGRAGLRIQLLEQRQGAAARGSRRARSPAPRPACRRLARRRRVGRESTGGGPSAPLYGTRTSVSDSRRRSSQVVGSSRMLGQLTAQFAIVRVPEHRGYRNLLLARLISALGTWTAFFAVRIAIYNQTGSAWWVSILLFCELVPSVILGIAIGPLIDRWPRQRMMILSDLGGAATFAVLPFVHSPAGDLRALGGGGLLGRVLPAGVLLGDPESRAQGLPRRRERARAGRRELATLIGPVLAGVGVALLGSSTVYALNAVSFLVSAMLLLRIGNRLQSSVPARIGRTHWREVRAGLSLVRNDRYLSSIALIWSWATLAYAGINVAEIVLTTDAYGAGNPGFGVFVAFSAAGILLGNVARVLVHRAVDGVRRLPRLVPRHRSRRRDLRRQPQSRDRLRRRPHLRDRKRHRPRLQHDADPAGRLGRAPRPGLRRARQPGADVHAGRDAGGRPAHRGGRPAPDVGHQRRRSSCSASSTRSSCRRSAALERPARHRRSPIELAADRGRWRVARQRVRPDRHAPRRGRAGRASGSRYRAAGDAVDAADARAARRRTPP